MPDISRFLESSRAAAEFKSAVLAYAEHHAVDRVRVEPNAPRVKVLRVLAQLLTELPHEAIERVAVTGESGCSDFRGSLTVATGATERTFDFVWDCAWRAEQEGWVDYYGYPDQIRAAREFGWRCFSEWRERSGPDGDTPATRQASAATR